MCAPVQKCVYITLKTQNKTVVVVHTYTPRYGGRGMMTLTSFPGLESSKPVWATRDAASSKRREGLRNGGDHDGEPSWDTLARELPYYKRSVSGRFWVLWHDPPLVLVPSGYHPQPSGGFLKSPKPHDSGDCSGDSCVHSYPCHSLKSLPSSSPTLPLWP